MTPTESFDGLDDFAGAGGWDEGARMLGLRFLAAHVLAPLCGLEAPA